MKGSSNTAQDFFNAARTPGAFSQLGEAALHWAIGKKLGKPGKLVYDAVTGLLAKGRDQDFERIQKMIDRAMLEPDYARQLLSRIRVQRRGRVSPVVPAGAAENAADEGHYDLGFIPSGRWCSGDWRHGRAIPGSERLLALAAHAAGQAVPTGWWRGAGATSRPVGGRERSSLRCKAHSTGLASGGGGGQRASPSQRRRLA